MHRSVLILGAVVAAFVGGLDGAHAGILNSAENFAVLGGSTVTSTGLATITGGVGVSPGTAITGFPPGVVTGGTIRSNDQVATQAQTDAASAFGVLAALQVTQVLTSHELGGLTLMPGVYYLATSAQMTGTLTLDGGGQVDPRFVFQIGSTLLTAAAASIVEINGAVADSTFFQVGTSATLGVGTNFQGTIIASASNTLAAGVKVKGRIISLKGAVTLDSDTVAVTHPPLNPAAPEPSSVVLILSGIGIIFGQRWRASRAA